MNIYGLNARADKITENPCRGKKKAIELKRYCTQTMPNTSGKRGKNNCDGPHFKTKRNLKLATIKQKPQKKPRRKKNMLGPL